jgi:acyl-CoA synthetase (AMP-forming)/AMP-acid ligase II
MVSQKDIPEGFVPISQLMSESDDFLEPAKVPKEDIIAILYTSGTTGFPKGALLTNEGFSRTVKKEAMLSAILPNSLINKQIGIFTLPVAHIMGYIMVISFLSMAVPWVFIRRFDPPKVLETIEKYKGTIFVGVPTMYVMLSLAEPEKYDLSSMRVWGAAGDAMPIEYIKKFKKFGGWRIFGIHLPPLYFEGYGQVETIGITCLKTGWFWWIPKQGSIGKVVRALKYKIVDEDGKEVKRGDAGELLVKGPRVCKGYWKSPEANKETFLPGGWFRTGDLVKQDIRGRLYFVDREKDMIKCGGYSIFSKEVEEEMKKNPKIEEVGVIGIKDELKGQKPVAIVKLKPNEKATPDEILEWAKENIAAYKAPREIEIVDDIPLGMTLKVDKKELRKRYAVCRKI